MTRLIAERTVTGEYGFDVSQKIIEKENSRYFLSQGFGGIDTVAGGAYRWEHGIVILLQDNDDFSKITDITLAGYDHLRPVLDWDGMYIKSCALAAK